MLEHLAEHLPEEHRNMQGLLAVATSSQVLTRTEADPGHCLNQCSMLYMICLHLISLHSSMPSNALLFSIVYDEDVHCCCMSM